MDENSLGKELLLRQLQRKGNVSLKSKENDGKIDDCRELLELICARVTCSDSGGHHAQNVILWEFSPDSLHEVAPLGPHHEIRKLIARVEDDTVPSLFDELARVVLVE